MKLQSFDLLFSFGVEILFADLRQHMTVPFQWKL